MSLYPHFTLLCSSSFLDFEHIWKGQRARSAVHGLPALASNILRSFYVIPSWHLPCKKLSVDKAWLFCWWSRASDPYLNLRNAERSEQVLLLKFLALQRVSTGMKCSAVRTNATDWVVRIFNCWTVLKKKKKKKVMEATVSIVHAHALKKVTSFDLWSCDACNKQGLKRKDFRFHCGQCSDYDLCAKCMQNTV